MEGYRHDVYATGPGTLAGRYLKHFWQPIYLEEQIAPKQAKPLRIMGEDYTLYRGESGSPYLVAQRCAHRGTQLSIGWVEGETIRCRYHGWRYDGGGQCVEQPAELQKHFCDKVRVRSWPVVIYKSVIFAYLGEGAPPSFPTYPEFEGDGWIEPIFYRRHCNYFNGIDNLFDESHVAYTHRYFFRNILEMPEIRYERTSFGATLFSARPGKGVRVRQFLMPNVLRLKVPTDDPDIPWSDYVNWRIPVDDAIHDTFGIRYVDGSPDALRRYRERREAARALPIPPMEDLAEVILRGEATLEEMEKRLGTRDQFHDVYLEDHITQVGQGVIADRHAECLGSADVGVRLLRDLWDQQLNRLADGKPVEVWSTPPHVRTSSGEFAEPAE